MYIVRVVNGVNNIDEIKGVYCKLSEIIIVPAEYLPGDVIVIEEKIEE